MPGTLNARVSRVFDACYQGLLVDMENNQEIEIRVKNTREAKKQGEGHETH